MHPTDIERIQFEIGILCGRQITGHRVKDLIPCVCAEAGHGRVRAHQFGCTRLLYRLLVTLVSPSVAQKLTSNILLARLHLQPIFRRAP